MRFTISNMLVVTFAVCNFAQSAKAQSLAVETRTINLNEPIQNISNAPIRIQFKDKLDVFEKINGLIPETNIPDTYFSHVISNGNLQCQFQFTTADVSSLHGVRIPAKAIFSGTQISVVTKDPKMLSELMPGWGDAIALQKKSVLMKLKHANGMSLTLRCNYEESFYRTSGRSVQITFKFDESEQLKVTHLSPATESKIKLAAVRACDQIRGRPAGQLDIKATGEVTGTCEGVPPVQRLVQPDILTYEKLIQLLGIQGFELSIPKTDKLKIRLAK